MNHPWHVRIIDPDGVKDYKAFDTVQGIFNRIKNYFNHVQKEKQKATTRGTHYETGGHPGSHS